MNVKDNEGRITLKVDEKADLDIEVEEEFSTMCKQS
jgi:hypothetical protein